MPFHELSLAPSYSLALVPASRPHPSSQAANFGNVVLLALRNPLTAFPAYHQSKAELYHGQKGQVEEGEWTKFRDQYVGIDDNSHLFNEWKNFIMEWRDMKPYSVGGYIPFEDWTDETKGPLLVRKISRILKKEGFPMLYDVESDDETYNVSSDATCLWYRHMFAPMMEDVKKRTDWYEPRYTNEQKVMIVAGLDRFANEIEQKQENDSEKRPGDEDRMAILGNYIQVIQATS